MSRSSLSAEPSSPLGQALMFCKDCFYASVFEHEDPALKALPLAVQLLP